MSGDQEDTTGPQSGMRVRAAPVLRLDLYDELRQLRLKTGYTQGEPAGMTLVKGPDLRIVLMAMMAGARMEEHHASGPISVQVLEGGLRLHLPEGNVELTAGHLLALEPNVLHDVEAIEDAAFLLTIGRTTYYEHAGEPHERRTQE